MTNVKEPIERPVAAATRPLQILEAFASAQNPLTLGELSERTGLFKSVILRYMISFEKLSFVLKRADGRYQLGIKALLLARAFDDGLNQREAIEAAMRRLVDDIGESVFFYVREGESRMCLMGLDSPHALRVNSRVGALIPMDSTSISKVLIDHGGGCPPGAAYGMEMLRSTIGEYDELTSSVSVPIFNFSGALVGALCVSGPTVRFDARAPHIYSLMLAEGLRLSEALGFVSLESAEERPQGGADCHG